ncbi:MAG: histidine kinase [Clostridia bacterium]|nr:histidine kinase [Clostridia bacterium]
MKHRKQQNVRHLTRLQKTFLPAFTAVIVVLCISIAAMLIAYNAYVTGKNDIYALEKQEKLNQMMESMETEIQIAEQQLLKLLSDSKVSRIAYSRNEMEPYNYYSQTLDIVSRMKEIADDFQIVQNIYLDFETIGVRLNQDGPVQQLPLSQEEFSQAAQQEMFASRKRLFIVRSLMDYQSPEPAELCTMALELNVDSLYERYSYLCLENEWIVLSVDGQVLRGERNASDKEVHRVISQASSYPLTVAVQVGPTKYHLSTDELLTAACVGVGITCLLAGAFILYCYFRLYRPLELLLDEAFLHLEKGELSYRIPNMRSGPFEDIYQTFNTSMDRLEYLMDHVYRQKLLISEMQLKHLQAQINPHFMYNTYYTLYRQLQDGSWDNSRQLARLLGDFYHYITRSSSMEKTLREEVKHTLTYVEIQTMRFPDTIQEIEPLPEEIADMTVPQLIMQPVFENVFQHARNHLHPGEPLHLAMRYRIEEDRVNVCVENNGDLSDDTICRLQNALKHVDDQEEITGLLNIHKRLQLFYGDAAGLSVSRSQLDGLCVCMHLIR